MGRQGHLTFGSQVARYGSDGLIEVSTMMQMVCGVLRTVAAAEVQEIFVELCRRGHADVWRFNGRQMAMETLQVCPG